MREPNDLEGAALSAPSMGRGGARPSRKKTIGKDKECDSFNSLKLCE